MLLSSPTLTKQPLHTHTHTYTNTLTISRYDVALIFVKLWTLETCVINRSTALSWPQCHTLFDSEFHHVTSSVFLNVAVIKPGSTQTSVFTCKHMHQTLTTSDCIFLQDIRRKIILFVVKTDTDSMLVCLCLWFQNSWRGIVWRGVEWGHYILALISQSRSGQTKTQLWFSLNVLFTKTNTLEIANSIYFNRFFHWVTSTFLH